MIPVNFRISLKPGELLAHVFTAMRLYLADGFILINLAIEIGKHFLVAHGSQGSEALVWIYAACFCLQTFVHHHQYTLVDAVVEFSSVAVQTYLDDAERATRARKETPVPRETPAKRVTPAQRATRVIPAQRGRRGRRATRVTPVRRGRRVTRENREFPGSSIS